MKRFGSDPVSDEGGGMEVARMEQGRFLALYERMRKVHLEGYRITEGDVELMSGWLDDFPLSDRRNIEVALRFIVAFFESCGEAEPPRAEELKGTSGFCDPHLKEVGFYRRGEPNDA